MWEEATCPGRRNHLPGPHHLAARHRLDDSMHLRFLVCTPPVSLASFKPSPPFASPQAYVNFAWVILWRVADGWRAQWWWGPIWKDSESTEPSLMTTKLVSIMHSSIGIHLRSFGENQGMEGEVRACVQGDLGFVAGKRRSSW